MATGHNQQPDQPMGAGDYGRRKPQPTNGRPFPGTRIKTTIKIRGYRRLGTVGLYEWDWNSHLFPVDIDHVGTRMLTPTEIDIINK
jgi:hypothetical protein